MRGYRNAALAVLYVVGIVLLIMRVMTFPGGDGGAPIVFPMAMLSLLVLSVAVMAFLFGYEPVHLYAQGRTQEAVAFFWKTVATFAGFTAVLFAAAYLYVARGG